MSDYQPGEIVNVEIEGARVVGVGDAGLGPYLRIAVTVNGHEGVSGVLVAADGVTVTSVAPATPTLPAEWPPQPGDLWRDASGCLLFARDLFEGDVSMAPEAGICDEETPASAWETFGPLTLVHREHTTSEAFDSTYGGQPT